MHKDFDIARWAPKFYFANKNILIMEQLKNYSLHMIPLSTQHLRAALNTLARFHASSILAEAHLGQPLNKVFPNSFNEKYYSNDGYHYEWVLKGADFAVAMAKKLELKNPEVIKWKMMKVLDTFKPTKLYRNVISHGDLHANNLMFDNNQPSRCIFIDFQLVRYAPLVLDLIQLVYLGTYENVTEQLKLDLLKHYHNVLQKIIVKNRSIDSGIRSYKEILEAFSHYDNYGKIIRIMYLSPLLKAFSILKKDFSDVKSMDESFHSTNVKQVFHFIDTNEKFKSQMKILINDILSIE